MKWYRGSCKPNPKVDFPCEKKLEGPKHVTLPLPIPLRHQVSPQVTPSCPTTMGGPGAVGLHRLSIDDEPTPGIPGLQDLDTPVRSTPDVKTASPCSPSYKEKRPQLLEAGGGIGSDDDVASDASDSASSDQETEEFASSSVDSSFGITFAKLVPPSPSRGEACRGGINVTAGKQALRRRSSLTPYISRKGESVVSVASVTADLASRGLWLEPRDIHYTADVEVGKGAMGVIYKAEYVTSSGQRTVAVKHMLTGGSFSESELLDAALHEMIMGFKIQAHENIIEFVGATQHPDHGLLLVYELIDGINMEDFIHAQKSSKPNWKPKLKYALKWGQQIFAALGVLHSARVPIVHRDVKPANLMLSRTSADGVQKFDVCDYCVHLRVCMCVCVCI